MKAIVISEFGNRSRLRFAEVPKPQPGEGEVLVRIKAAGVNPVDWKIREGLLDGFLPHQFPLIPGWDMAGVVEAVGHSARRFAKGDEVYGYCRRPVVQHGTYAEFIAVPESYLTLRPRNLSFEEAAAIPLAALTAYQSLFDAAGLKRGQSVLVVGASGGVGSFAVQLAAAAGACVFAVASRANHAYLRRLGAAKAFDYQQTGFGAAFRKAMPDGADVVFDCVGDDTFKMAQECVRKGGQLVSILEEMSEEDARQKGIGVHYVFVEPNVRELDHIRKLVEAGKVKVFLAGVHPLAQAAKAHEQMETGHTRGKIVLRM